MLLFLPMDRYVTVYSAVAAINLLSGSFLNANVAHCRQGLGKLTPWVLVSKMDVKQD